MSLFSVQINSNDAPGAGGGRQAVIPRPQRDAGAAAPAVTVITSSPAEGRREALRRFEQAMGCFFPQARQRFNMHEFMARTNEYYKQHGIPDDFRVQNNQLYAGSSVPSMVVNNVATLNDNFFFTDNNGRYFSVRDEEMRDIARARGYFEVEVLHCMAKEQLPPPLALVTPRREREDPETAAVRFSEYPFFDQGKLPALYIKENETYATAIVRAWEDRIIVGEVAFPPFVNWNSAEAKSYGLKESLTRIAKPYVAVKKCHTIAGSTQDMLLPVAALSKEATEWRKAHPTVDEWFEIARQLALESAGRMLV